MSCDITSLQQRIEQPFSLPYQHLLAVCYCFFHDDAEAFDKGIDITQGPQGFTTLTLHGGASMTGKVLGETFELHQLECTGDWSNSFLEDIFLPACEQARGKLKLELLWEEELWERITIDNGVIEREKEALDLLRDDEGESC